MKNRTWLKTRAESKIGKPGFETQRLLLRLTEGFAARMEQRKLRRADLAREMGVDRAMVTRILNGDQNVTMKTLVAMACALDARLHFELQDLAAVRESTTEAVRARLKQGYGNVIPLQRIRSGREGVPLQYLQMRDALPTTFTSETTGGTALPLEGQRDTTAA